MLKKIAFTLVVLLVGFLAYVSTRPGEFRYERSGVINASPEVIFPYLSEFRKGGEWSPYEQKDPNMKKEISGPDGQPGATYVFSGNSDVGAGRLEMLAVEPNKSVKIRLLMTKPINADHTIDYILTPEESGATRFTWVMSGDGGFLGKLMGVLIDCDKMIGADMEKGIVNLSQLIGSKKAGN